MMTIEEQAVQRRWNYIRKNFFFPVGKFQQGDGENMNCDTLK